MPVQTTYTAYHKAAVEGQRVDQTLCNVDSYVAEVDVLAGRAVVAGTADGSCKLPTAITQRFLGVTQYTSAGQYDEAGVHEYQADHEVNVIDFGKVWVTATGAVSAGDPVHVRVLNITGAEVVGGFENAADGTDTFEVPGAYWATSAGVGELAQIKIKYV